MPTHFYCWEPSLRIDLLNPDLLEELKTSQPVKPSSRLLTFVEALLLRFPDIERSGSDIIWATTPIRDNIIGRFVDLAVGWYYYEEAKPFIVATAIAHGLRCYDLNERQIDPVRAANFSIRDDGLGKSIGKAGSRRSG